MNIKRILCPVDFSEFNRPANEYASMLAKSTGARMIYLHIYLPEIAFSNPEFFDAESEEKRLLAKLEEEFSPCVPGIDASYVVEFGTPTEGIVNYANNNEIDLVVLGTHGRTGLLRVVMGSVAEAVVRKTDCPVLAIKADNQVLQNA